MLLTKFAPVFLTAALGILVALPASASSPHLAIPRPIRIATHDQAPYGSFLPDKTFDGTAVRMMSCVLKRMKRAYVVEVYPWERTQMLAERGEVDGFFPATIKPERLLWAQASDLIASQKWVWYLPIDSRLDPMTADFKTTAKVGAHFGSNRLKMLETDGYQVVLKPQTDALLLKAFLLGRADAILGGDLAINAAIKEQSVDPERLRMVVFKDNPLSAYFGRKFLKGEPNFMAEFNAQIPACR